LLQPKTRQPKTIKKEPEKLQVSIETSVDLIKETKTKKSNKKSQPKEFEV
jgi:hypothetical protein